MRHDREWWSRDEALDAPGVVEALVAEAERGYEGPRAEFVSRPPDPEIEALRRIVFRVPAKVRDAAQKRADAEERSLSELAAAALEEYLAQRGAARKRGAAGKRGAARKGSAARKGAAAGKRGAAGKSAAAEKKSGGSARAAVREKSRED